MALEWDIARELEAELRAEAEERKQSVDDLVLDMLVKHIHGRQTESSAQAKPVSGSEAVEYLSRHGVLGAWADRNEIGDSAEYARELRRRAETREW
jgi:hypothetical protein